MADFTADDLSGSRFERVDLTGAEFRAVDLSPASFRGVDFSGAAMRGAEIVDVRIDGEIQNLVVNGVDVAPLVNAELDRRDPSRAKMRPADAAGFRDAWVQRAILGDPSPWDPLDLPWEEMPDTPGIPWDRQVRPSLDEVLVLRRDRLATVRTVIDGLTDASLATHTEPVEGPGWPSPESFQVRGCLLIVLNEEWHHRQFAERDLAALETEARRQATCSAFAAAPRIIDTSAHLTSAKCPIVPVTTVGTPVHHSGHTREHRATARRATSTRTGSNCVFILDRAASWQLLISSS